MSTDVPARPAPSPSPGLRYQTKMQLRRRRLASDHRAGMWARNEARAACWSYARTYWRLLAAVGGVALGLTGGLTWLTPAPFMKGAIVGVGVTLTVVGLVLIVVDATGVSHRMHGASAEQLTAMQLRPLQAHGWRLLNHFALENHDIDHVLVGPGGVIVVETKWAADSWHDKKMRYRLDAAVAQSCDNAEDLVRRLKSLGIAEVRSAVFLWTAVRPDRDEQPSEPFTVGATRVIRGRSAAERWREQLIDRPSRHPLNPDEVARAWTHLEELVAKKDAHTVRTKGAPPPSLARVYGTACAMLVAFFAAGLANLQLVTTVSLAMWACGTGAQAVFGLATARYRATRIIAGAWLAGTLTAAALIAIVTAIERV